jgi:hypothetical protein
MSASVGVNVPQPAPNHALQLIQFLQVLRWSALGVGVFYGAYHQLSLTARDKMAREQKEWARKESLITQAKQEWARRNPQAQPAPRKSGGTFGCI